MWRKVAHSFRVSTRSHPLHGIVGTSFGGFSNCIEDNYQRYNRIPTFFPRHCIRSFSSTALADPVVGDDSFYLNSVSVGETLRHLIFERNENGWYMNGEVYEEYFDKEVLSAEATKTMQKLLRQKADRPSPFGFGKVGIEGAEEFFDFLLSVGIADAFQCSVLIRGYRSPEDAVQVLQKMRDASISLNDDIFRSIAVQYMISAGGNGNPCEAWRKAEELITQHGFICTPTVKVTAKKRDLPNFKQISSARIRKLKSLAIQNEDNNKSKIRAYEILNSVLRTPKENSVDTIQYNIHEAHINELAIVANLLSGKVLAEKIAAALSGNISALSDAQDMVAASIELENIEQCEKGERYENFSIEVRSERSQKLEEILCARLKDATSNSMKRQNAERFFESLVATGEADAHHFRVMIQFADCPDSAGKLIEQMQKVCNRKDVIAEKMLISKLILFGRRTEAEIVAKIVEERNGKQACNDADIMKILSQSSNELLETRIEILRNAFHKRTSQGRAQAEKIFQSLATGGELDTEIFNVMMAGAWNAEDVLLMLEQMQHAKIPLTAVTYTTVIDALVLEGRREEAKALFEEATRSGAKLDLRVEAALNISDVDLAEKRRLRLQQYVRQGEKGRKEAHRLYQYIDSVGEATPFQSSVLTKSGISTDSFSIKTSNINSNIQSGGGGKFFTSRIREYLIMGGREGNLRAYQLLKNLLAAGEACVDDCVLLLRASWSAKHARLLLDEIVESFPEIQLNSSLYNELIRKHMIEGDQRIAGDVLREMRSAGISPDAGTRDYLSMDEKSLSFYRMKLLSRLFSCGEDGWDEAQILFKKLWMAKEVDERHCNLVLKNVLDPVDGNILLNNMIDAKIDIGPSAFNTVITDWMIFGEAEKARAMVARNGVMTLAGIEPDQRTNTVLTLPLNGADLSKMRTSKLTRYLRLGSRGHISAERLFKRLQSKALADNHQLKVMQNHAASVSFAGSVVSTER
eukprot:g4530.t1